MNWIQFSTLVVSLAGLAFSLYIKFKLDKKHYALEMIREWNQQTAKDKILIEKAIPGIYEKCHERRLKRDMLEKIYNAAYSSREADDSGIDYFDVKESIIRLLNYFEFVSSAYLNGAVDKKIIQKSFSGTIVRYYCVLYCYLEMEIDKTKRNPWEPYSEFVRTVTVHGYKYPLLTPCLSLQNGDLICSNNHNIKLKIALCNDS